MHTSVVSSPDVSAGNTGTCTSVCRAESRGAAGPEGFHLYNLSGMAKESRVLNDWLCLALKFSPNSLQKLLYVFFFKKATTQQPPKQDTRGWNNLTPYKISCVLFDKVLKYLARKWFTLSAIYLLHFPQGILMPPSHTGGKPTKD